MISTLSPDARNIVEQYLHLPLGDKLVGCPYHKNSAGKKGWREEMGKGSPAEIIEIAETRARQYNINLKNLSEQQIRQFMRREQIGVDCSGFIAHVLRSMDNELVKALPLVSALWFHPFRYLSVRLRPVENISVKTLTHRQNSEKISSWQYIRPGDIIRTRKGRHALFVTQTHRNQAGELKDFVYAHSTSYYGDEQGVRQGKVVTVYPKENLKDQSWEETDNLGRNYSFEGFLQDDGLNGVYRLKI